ncbi:MAG TPA: peptide chain release factor N(5)-glutamine methyltransferase, partial [Alphaproteobacteria bacterium]|nr:peptide chain release factor N(5)-glutamine methyltransferase [Alphaproteobacteria bacterium]
RLTAAGVPEPRRDARLLVGHALGGGSEIVLGFPERILTDDEAERIAALVALRAARRPVAQILGRREFWSLNFAVTADTLDPRPDSECLIEAVLAHVPDRNARLNILDFGTGTGCLLLALLHELPRATGLGIDLSAAACAVAERNAAALGLSDRAAFAVSDWGRAVAGAYDLIVANPPYISEPELAGLEPEVSLFEPKLALNGGGDGLAAYRALAPDLARLLAPNGCAAIEIGFGQAEAVASVLGAHGIECIATSRDLASHQRCLIVRQAR